MSETTVAAVQMKMTANPAENISRAETLAREAAKQGAQIVLLPELFERPYFCQERRYEYPGLRAARFGNPAVRRFQIVAKELNVVIPVSFYERDGNRQYNSLGL